MIQQHGGDNVLSISEDEDFCHLAMQLFRAAGHTFNVKEAISNKKIQDFVYIDIQHNQVLTPMDWNYLNQVISVSLLFSNGANYFDVPNCDIEIDYYAISLNAINSERSPLAHEIHKVVSRLSMAPLSVILFEVKGFYMFSFAERKKGQQSTVIISDWFPLNSVIETDILLRVDATNFTNTSVMDFFYDFEYAIARPYYIYPISFEYAKYEMFPLTYFEENDVGCVDRETINEIFRDNYLLPLRVYRYDYVAEDSNKKKEQFFSTEDISLDLLELEMDIMNPDEEDVIFDDAIDEKEFIYEEDEFLDELDVELFDDPIKMLKWIRIHKRV